MILGRWRLKYRKKKAKPKSAAPGMKEYRKRNEKLPLLGYSTYREYLGSPEWAVIRADKLRRFPDCLLCQNPACQVHHLNYRDDTLLGLNNRGLVTLCRGCHEGIEFDGGRKRTMPEANRFLRAKAQELGRHRWLEMEAKSRVGDRTRNKKIRKASKVCIRCKKNPRAKGGETSFCGQCQIGGRKTRKGR